jgi:hypothetical protein
LVASGIQVADADMARQTIVVAGAKFRDGRNGFYVLTERSETNSGASGEDLLDYKCSILRGR